MGEFADDAGFAKETVAGIAAGKFGGKQFYSDGTIDQGIMAADYATVGTDAESFMELVAADLHGECTPQCADKKRR
jgi:hypothetical protein